MTRRAIEITGTPVVIELSKFATPRVEREFIHLDRLPDGTWRLLFNVKDVDVAAVQALTFIREDK